MKAVRSHLCIFFVDGIFPKNQCVKNIIFVIHRNLTSNRVFHLCIAITVISSDSI